MTVLQHFVARAERYNRSSHWVTDAKLLALMRDLLALNKTDQVLDVACGTGLVAESLRGHVGRIVGLDMTPEMTAQAGAHVDELVHGEAEKMPFADDLFDRVVCRQGIQFMDDRRAVAEMVRVCRPGGRICIVNLCAYGEDDRPEYFEILRLRNPARRNFYLRQDLTRLLRDAGCREASLTDYVSREDIDTWSDHGAIEEPAREAIRAVYRKGSPAFTKLHSVELSDGRIIDMMLFGVAVGVK